MENKLTAEEILNKLDFIVDFTPCVNQIRINSLMYNDIISAMHEYALQSQPPTVTDEWVRVKDKLPTKRMLPVLLFNGDAPEYAQHVFKGTWFKQSKSFIRDVDSRDNITHWMPLPSPPMDAQQTNPE